MAHTMPKTTNVPKTTLAAEDLVEQRADLRRQFGAAPAHMN